MIGRAAASNPWIFRQIQQYVATGEYEQPTEQDRYEMIRDYYRMLMNRSDRISGRVDGKMKQFATYFTRGVRNGSQLRKAIYRCDNPQDVIDTVERFFEEQLAAEAA